MKKADTQQQGRTQQDVSSLAAYLLGGREERGLSAADLAQRAGLPLPAITALENGRFAEVGPPVFVRGYLIRYCRALGLAEEAVLERYRALGLAEPPPLRLRGEPDGSAPRGQGVLRPFTYLLVLVLLAYGGWRGFELVSTYLAGSGTSGTTTTSDAGVRQELALPNAAPPPATSAAAGSAPVAPPLASAAPPAPPPEPVARAATAEAATLQPSPAASVAAPSATAAVTPSVANAPAASAPAAAADAEARLELEFTAASWAEVRDGGGRILLNGTLRAGSARTLTGKAPFKIALGNAQAVRLKLDGTPVDTAVYAPKRGTVSRFTLGADQAAGSGD